MEFAETMFQKIFGIFLIFESECMLNFSTFKILTTLKNYKIIIHWDHYQYFDLDPIYVADKAMKISHGYFAKR